MFLASSLKVLEPCRAKYGGVAEGVIINPSSIYCNIYRKVAGAVNTVAPLYLSLKILGYFVNLDLINP